MPLSISQIMSVCGISVMQAMRKPYVVGNPYLLGDMCVSNLAYSYSHPSGQVAMIPMVWAAEEDVARITERQKIEFVQSLLTNAVEAMDRFLAENQANAGVSVLPAVEANRRIVDMIFSQDVEVQDVDFGE